MEWLFRIKAILLAPHTEWPVIAQEKGDAQALFIPYVAVLALVPALAHFIGAALVGGYAPILSSLAGAVGKASEGLRVADRHVGQDLAIQLHARGLHAVHEL